VREGALRSHQDYHQRGQRGSTEREAGGRT
jgi:hypothetical protein